MANINGQFHVLTYGATDVLVEDTFGHQLTFTQDEHFQPLSLVTSSLSTTYTYDSSRLTQVTTLAGGQTFERTFHYENATYPQFLTGITDERGVRYVTWEYDSSGRATKSVHADGADETSIVYNTDGSVTVTNALGREVTYHYVVIDGVKRIASIDGEPTPNCPASNSSYSYDTRGLLTSKTDERGIVTVYQYNSRGLETSRTEASGTPEARTITTQWHPTLQLPVMITEPQRVTEMTYDATGRLLSQVVTPQP
ncbi:MAG: RHS repeat protein [Marinobacterium sp.]